MNTIICQKPWTPPCRKPLSQWDVHTLSYSFLRHNHPRTYLRFHWLIEPCLTLIKFNTSTLSLKILPGFIQTRIRSLLTVIKHITQKPVFVLCNCAFLNNNTWHSLAHFIILWDPLPLFTQIKASENCFVIFCTSWLSIAIALIVDPKSKRSKTNKRKRFNNSQFNVGKH